MPNWNPSFPEVLGNEWFANIGRSVQVWAGAPAPMARLPSTAAETINSLKLSATVNPMLSASVPTLIDVVEEGNEDIGLFSEARLIPSADKTNEGWTTDTGATTNIYQAIDEDAFQWPGPADAGKIQATSSYKVFTCSVDASAFASGGAQQNARIGWVSVQAILGANTGFRKIAVALEIGGTRYDPAGGNLRDASGFGATYPFWWGEINPSTGRPWTPADIANFGSAGTGRIWIKSSVASPTQYPVVAALCLRVHYITTENRVAVGVWRRPDNIGTNRLVNITTDALRAMPAGTAGWSKLASRNYLYYWRQSISPSQYGAVVADDVRWNILHQELPVNAQPAGVSFAPGGVVASRLIAHDNFGRPSVEFPSTADAKSIGAGAGLVLVRSDAATSVDSQPYRGDITDLAKVTSAQKLGQRVTPASSQSYVGVRLLVMPPASGNPTLTVSVIRVSDSVQIGGTFTITADTVRALPSVVNTWRYVTGFLSSAAALVGGTAYEIRLSSTAGGEWLAVMPDCSLGNTASFGGSANGGFIGATHFADRELVVALTRQPDPPTGVTAQRTDVAVTTFSDQSTIVKHIQVLWTVPASGMGATFARYEIERQYTGGPWQRVANITTPATTSWIDRETRRGVATTYRIRAIGTDGRFSAYGTSGSITAFDTDSRPMLILSSNHRPDLYFVHLYELTEGNAETSYPVLSAEHDEVIAVHGTDYQVVFMEAEDRGVGWRTRATLKQNTVASTGQARFTSLLALVRAFDIPYVCAMDHQGNYMLGHVSVDTPTQSQPDYRFGVELDIIPTHTEPVPVTL